MNIKIVSTTTLFSYAFFAFLLRKNNMEHG